MGLFWPFPNHTVAVWVLHPVEGPVVRVVVPTSQIFLGVTDTLNTRTFDPWHQKTIYEYTRRDVAGLRTSCRGRYPTSSSRSWTSMPARPMPRSSNCRYMREAVFLEAQHA